MFSKHDRFKPILTRYQIDSLNQLAKRYQRKSDTRYNFCKLLILLIINNFKEF